TQSKDVEVQSKEDITPRIAMQETALFAPTLDIRNGEVHMETVMPDALTRWNIRLFAHAKDMSFGTLDTSIISQKDFMMTSNVPRFVRHGDQMQLRSTLFVLGSTTTIKGKATLAYFLDDDSLNVNTITSDFTASISSPGQVQWNITIPKGRNITCTFSGEFGSYQDAERYSIPILPSTLPITDRYPIWLNPDVNTSQSLALEDASDIQSLSIQLSSEPYWYALEALPDLMQTSYGSSLDHMNRFLSSIFAKKFVLGNATLSTVLRDSIMKGRISGNLNPEKGITQNDIGPWESDMLSQDQQASNISIYADPEKIQRIGEHAFDELQKMQSTSGAFPWFPSMSESPYITRQMLIGFGIAESLSSISTQNRDAFFLINRMIEWLDETYTKELE
ncbi:MAG: alpha-2-macroglobulin family protein, partial [Ignavibacteria bacterium]